MMMTHTITAALAKSARREADMLRHFLTTVTATAVLAATLAVQAAEAPTMSNENFADVNGQRSGVALQTAIRHSHVVDRPVLLAATMRRDGSYPEAVAAFNQLQVNAVVLGGAVKALPLGQAYPDVDWTNLFRKVGDLTKRPFEWSADVAKVQARTLLVFADADSKSRRVPEFVGHARAGQGASVLQAADRP